jgi:hypothetical protein
MIGEMFISAQLTEKGLRYYRSLDIRKMFFVYKGQEYRIVFSHFRTEHGKGSKKTLKRHTKARIFTGERDSQDEILICTGIVTLYAKDKFVKAEGRKQALRLAMAPENFMEWNGDKQHWKCLQDREFRSAAWKAFHSVYFQEELPMEAGNPGTSFYFTGQ